MAFQRANLFQQDAIEIHPDLLYFWVTRRGESGRAATASGLVLHIDNELVYEPFANDFGPLHLGCTYRFCRKLSFLLKGIYKAKQVGFIDWHLPQSTFNLKKYEFYEQVINGDWNWIIPNKFLAFSGPTCRSREQSVYGTLGCLDYVPLFRQEAITGIVRLNRAQYDKRDFTAAGFSHYDLYFPDGTTPPSSILQTFLNIAESEPGAIAVHCKAGLGRTGTLIGCYIMKHYGFTAAEVIAYIRLCRPGSILGPQQIYLHEQQARMWTAGKHQGQPTAAGATQRNTVPASLSAPARSRSVSSVPTRAASLSSYQQGATSAYTTKPSPSMQTASAAAGGAPPAVPHPAGAGFAAVDSTPALMQRQGSMPTRVGSSFGASPSTRSPAGLVSLKSDSANLADAAEQDLIGLSLSQQRGTDTSAADKAQQVVRTLAANGQPRKVLAPSASATAESSISAQHTTNTSPAGTQRDIRRTASNGQPRKGLSLTRPADSIQGQIRNTSFRNRDSNR